MSFQCFEVPKHIPYAEMCVGGGLVSEPGFTTQETLLPFCSIRHSRNFHSSLAVPRRSCWLPLSRAHLHCILHRAPCIVRVQNAAVNPIGGGGAVSFRRNQQTNSVVWRALSRVGLDPRVTLTFGCVWLSERGAFSGESGHRPGWRPAGNKEAGINTDTW